MQDHSPPTEATPSMGLRPGRELGLQWDFALPLAAIIGLFTAGHMFHTAMLQGLIPIPPALHAYLMVMESQLVLACVGIIEAMSIIGMAGWLVYRKIQIPLSHLHGQIQFLLSEIEGNQQNSWKSGAEQDLESIRNIIGILSRRLRTYAGNLTREKTEAEAISQQKSDFLANMSHELRTPLNSIIGMADLLLEDKLTPSQQEMLGIMHQSSHSLLEIVNDILDLSKIESGSLELEHIPVRPKGILNNIQNMMAPVASRKGLILRFEHMGPDVYILGDPTRLARIIINLVGNAIKYTEKGQIVVQSRMENISGPRRGWLCVDVTDTGIGIPPEKIESIFDKFVQVDASTTRKYGGSGLGLAITKQLVSLMGGTISVQSGVGFGSCFSIRMPVETTDAPAHTTADTDAPRPAGYLAPSEVHIVVVEDHELNQAYMKKLLPTMGLHHVTYLVNGREALDWVQKTPDTSDVVMFMDCHMPEMNGYEATRAIRALDAQRGQRTAIIAMTANAMMGEREKCLEAGMDEYVSKPVSKQMLATVVARWIALEAPAPRTAPVPEPAPEPAPEPVPATAPQALLQPEATPPAPAAPQAFPNTEEMNFSALDELIGDDPATKREMFEMFLEQGAQLLEALITHAELADTHPWVETSHKLKGSAATVGANILRQHAADAQMMAEATPAQRQEALIGMQQAFGRVEHLLRDYLAAQSNP